MIVIFLLNPNSGTFPNNIGYIKGIYPLALNVNFEMMTRDDVAFLFLMFLGWKIPSPSPIHYPIVHLVG